MSDDDPWWHDATADQPPAAGSGAGSGADAIGPAAAEAARLFEAVRDRVLADPTTMRTGLRLLELFTTARGAPAAPGDAPECAYCPVCQAIRQARGLDPATVERLTGAALEFAETLRSVVAPTAEPPDDRVRHVPLDDDGTAETGDHESDDHERDGHDTDDGFAGWPSAAEHSDPHEDPQ